MIASSASSWELQPIVERLLEVSGILPLLDVVPTVERALDALASSAAPADLATHADQ